MLMCACYDLQCQLRSHRCNVAENSKKQASLFTPAEDTQQIAWAQAICNGVEAIGQHTHQFHCFPWRRDAYATLAGWSIGKFRGWTLLGGHNGVEKGEMLSCTELRFCACITPGTTLQMLNKDKSKRLDCNESWDCLLCARTKSPGFAGGTI